MIRKLLCRWGLHAYRPERAFQTRIVDDGGGVVGYDESWTGKVCMGCGKRKIERKFFQVQSVGATQDAYDWLRAEK